MSQGSKLPRMHVASSEYAAGQRFERWRAGIAGTYAVSLPDGLRAEDFEFEISLWQFGKLLLNHASFGPRLQSRTPRNIRGDQLDHYRLVLQTAGVLRIDTGSQRLVVQPGELLVSDLSREEVFESDRGENIVLFVPREMLDDALPRPFDLHGVMPRGAAARMLADHLRALVAASSQLSLEEAPSLTQATVNLLAASLVPSAHNIDHARPTVESTLLRQMCRYVDLHLSDFELSADGIGTFFKVSRSTLYRLFEPLGGVSHFVRERRLARVHALLAGSQQRVYLGRVAEDHGFRSATHFSRAFREQYGYSPNEVRQQTVGASLDAGARAPAKGVGFDLWLRSLRD